MIDHDVIIIGGGLAGSRAALEITRQAPHLNIGLVAKTHPIRSHSVAAQGGIAATLKNADPEDTWEAHAFDTVKGSDYLADQDAVEILTREAPEVVVDLERMGVNGLLVAILTIAPATLLTKLATPFCMN